MIVVIIAIAIPVIVILAFVIMVKSLSNDFEKEGFNINKYND